MRYNITCSSCGKPQHHKQIKFNETFTLSTQSALLGLGRQMNLRLCNICLAELFKYMLDCVDSSTFNRIIERHGDEQHNGK